MEIIRGYEELLDLAVSTVHPIEAVMDRLVLKGIILPEVARRFLAGIK
jgi:hypothetical protein